MDPVSRSRLHSRRKLKPSDGEGFLIVYSIANRITFERVERIIERVYRVQDEAGPSSPGASPYNHYPQSPYSPQQAPVRRRIPIVVVGTKRALYNNREVSTDEGRMLAQRLRCDFYETSAKQNANVEAAFKSIVRSIKVAKTGGVAPGTGASGKKRKKNKGCVVL